MLVVGCLAERCCWHHLLSLYCQALVRGSVVSIRWSSQLLQVCYITSVSGSYRWL